MRKSKPTKASLAFFCCFMIYACPLVNTTFISYFSHRFLYFILRPRFRTGQISGIHLSDLHCSIYIDLLAIRNGSDQRELFKKHPTGIYRSYPTTKDELKKKNVLFGSRKQRQKISNCII